MKTKMKTELCNDVMTGLMVAAIFAAVAPGDAFAQLSAAVGAAQSDIAAPFLRIVSYISYALGTVMTVAGIAGAKQHADAPASNKLAPAIGKLGAGMAFLAAPSLIGMMLTTGTDTLGNGTGAFTPIGGF
jgi:hypothetical protein